MKKKLLEIIYEKGITKEQYEKAKTIMTILQNQHKSIPRKEN